MTKEQAEFIDQAMDYAGEECQIHPDYSGRGMNGRTTYAVSFSSFGLLFHCVLSFVKENLETLEENQIPDFGSLRQDNLGRDTIIY